ncbi:hypothetical protein NBRC116188_19660 [Oceaniserpentilla sp. 4NH20-0058]|uniref:hypothetical protein n=1 Tax=Oceaniserpentilla sp. 4NH20-0058 TaxID=3127660 RepID=UPI00310905BA
MNKFIVIILTFYLMAPFTLACETDSSDKEVEGLLDDLAQSMGMEFVYGDKFPNINPYGSYGSSFVLDPVVKKGVESSVFFLARKKKSMSVEIDWKDTNSLIKNYDYFYIYAEKEAKSKSFKVKDLISNGVGLFGMTLYYGWVDLDTKEFKFVDSDVVIDSKKIDRRKLSIAILISSMSSTKFLFNYDGKWIQSVELEI